MKVAGIAARLAAAAGTGVAAVLVAVSGPGVAAAAPGCIPWTTERVAEGYGTLENLAFDGRGGLLLSETSLTGAVGAIRRLEANGSRSTAVPEVKAPGAIVVVGETAYFTTGNGFVSGLLGRGDGTIDALDLDTGAVTTVETGLTMPNGLAQLPDGDFVVSRDIGQSTGLTRVPGSAELPSGFAPSLSSTNGLAYDEATRRLYVATTFNPVTTIAAVDIDHPDAPPRRFDLPGVGPINSADDLTVGPDGSVYVALNVAGTVVRLDPATGAQCTIVAGLPLISSVRFGSGPGWDPNALYATSFLGTVVKLTPPAS
ncbi:SMP-30/gluconolactonase/LRE family protein [Rhodococcus oryzae]|uniref:SMP-30/gluconolactonase/LRE family protein n=1 Tax=Rhodococcus oryzae TaxID=2571143 RepID=UPI003721B60E